MKRFRGFGLVVFAVLFLGTLASADQPAPQKKYDIEFGEWKPVKVAGITREGAAVFEGQGSDMMVRRPSGRKHLVFRFVCWREARSGILCFGRESRFYVCLEDRVIGLPQDFQGRSTTIEVYERKVALEDVTKTRDELLSHEKLGASFLFDFKEALNMEEALGSDFLHATSPNEISTTTIDHVTLAGEEMTLHLINAVKDKAQVTFSARTLKPVRAQVEGKK